VRDDISGFTRRRVAVTWNTACGAGCYFLRPLCYCWNACGRRSAVAWFRIVFCRYLCGPCIPAAALLPGRSFPPTTWFFSQCVLLCRCAPLCPTCYTVVIAICTCRSFPATSRTLRKEYVVQLPYCRQDQRLRGRVASTCRVYPAVACHAFLSPFRLNNTCCILVCMPFLSAAPTAFFTLFFAVVPLSSTLHYLSMDNTERCAYTAGADGTCLQAFGGG